LEGSIRASKEEYEQLPPYMKALASWEVCISSNLPNFKLLYMQITKAQAKKRT
jgi:hypothetical protein